MSTRSLPGELAFIWGWAAGLWLFGSAVVRLGARGVATMRDGLSVMEWILLAVTTVVFIYGEGIRALGRRWVPLFLERLGELRSPSRGVFRALAPLYGFNLVGAPPGALVRRWGVSAGIIVAVLVVRGFPEPWRGIVDFAVASALAWAMAVMIVGGARAFGRAPVRRAEGGHTEDGEPPRPSGSMKHGSSHGSSDETVSVPLAPP